MFRVLFNVCFSFCWLIFAGFKMRWSGGLVILLSSLLKGLTGPLKKILKALSRPPYLEACFSCVLSFSLYPFKKNCLSTCLIRVMPLFISCRQSLHGDHGSICHRVWSFKVSCASTWSTMFASGSSTRCLPLVACPRLVELARFTPSTTTLLSFAQTRRHHSHFISFLTRSGVQLAALWLSSSSGVYIILGSEFLPEHNRFLRTTFPSLSCAFCIISCFSYFPTVKSHVPSLCPLKTWLFIIGKYPNKWTAHFAGLFLRWSWWPLRRIQDHKWSLLKRKYREI